ncbi:MAG: hypothetical protein LBG96_13870 [Tannerella sp.]|jgi:hypothetical protein|nr:hypothetical protein [Tannerella sp.]
MKRIIILIFFCTFIGYTSARFKSGLILSGGKGNISNSTLSSNILRHEEDELSRYTHTVGNKASVAIGYKFRFQAESKRFFYDIDLYSGIKPLRIKYSDYDYYQSTGAIESGNAPAVYGITSTKDTYYYFSINPSWNYHIVKGLHAGVGIEPTLYYFSELKFDTPITARIGYDFRFIDIALKYKAGLLNAMNPDYLSSGRFNDWQIQVFIPF